MAEAAAEKTNKKPKYKRSAKNYLLDPHFQLKYTGFLVAIALFLSVALGAILVVTSQDVLEQTQATLSSSQAQIRLGQATVDRGKEVIVQSQKVSKVVSMNIAKEYADDPELAETFGAAAKEDEEKLQRQQDLLEKDAAYLRQRAKEIGVEAAAVQQRQETMLTGIVIVLAILVLSIGLAGIVFTHKIAGPIFKMKRLLRQVGEGKLVVRERLRKGDELHHFFETFEKMVEDMRARQKQEIGMLDDALEHLKDAKEEDLEPLRKLRADMEDHLEA